jgi:DNA-binding transcriptional regulator YiaG
MHTGAYGSSPGANSKKKKGGRQRRVDADQFRMARRFSGLSREETAELVGVSLRTIGHWETGRARPSFAAFKLLRIYRHGDLIDPSWSGYSIIRGKLVTPENHTFEPGELSWLSLLVRRAHAFSELLAQRDSRAHLDAAPAAPCEAASASQVFAMGTDAHAFAPAGLSPVSSYAMRPCEAGVASHSSAGAGDSPRLIGESVKLNEKVIPSVGAFVAAAPVVVCVPRGTPSANTGTARIGGAL